MTATTLYASNLYQLSTIARSSNIKLLGGRAAPHFAQTANENSNLNSPQFYRSALTSMIRHAKMLRHAVKDGKIVHVDDVETGLECGCYCPAEGCQEPLIAKNRRFANRVQITYFSHHSRLDCPGARESALHLMAKEIVLEKRQIWAPRLHLFPDGAEPWRIYKSSGVLELTDVKDEVRVEGFIPDLMAKNLGVTILIEICVTHEVDQKKLAASNRLGWTILEVDIGDLLHTDYTREDVCARLLGSGSQARWLRHEGVVAKRVAISKKSIWLQTEVADCPLSLGLVKSFHVQEGKLSWGFHKNDAPCDRCPCRLDQMPQDSRGERNLVQCTGSEAIDSPAAFDRPPASKTSPAPNWLRRFKLERSIRDEERYLQNNRLRFGRAEERLKAALRRWQECAQAKEDADWIVPFCEIGAGERCVEITPNPTFRRLRPLPHKRPLRLECAETMSQTMASNFGLFWDLSLNNWVYLDYGSYTRTEIGAAQPTVPMALRRFIDPASSWVPVFPEERNRLRAIRNEAPHRE